MLNLPKQRDKNKFFLFKHFSAKKASALLLMIQSSPFGLRYSFYDIQSSSLEEGIAVMTSTIWMRDTDQNWPVYSSNSYFYALGPLNRETYVMLNLIIEFPPLIQSCHFIGRFPCTISTWSISGKTYSPNCTTVFPSSTTFP